MADDDTDDRRATGDVRVADTIGDRRYQLRVSLGAGRVGARWRAHDTLLGRDVVLELLDPGLGGPDAEARIVAEVRAMARLAHPAIVAVYDVGHHHGRPFLTTELVEGVTLSRWLATPRRWRDVVAVFRAAGEGLAAAHAAGIVHGDLGPDAILIGDDGRVRVTDLGVAAAAGGATDAAGDQRAFAGSLFEALHGPRTFTVVDGRPPPPVRPVPRWLTEVIERAAAADPGQRLPSMAALVAALGPRRGRGRWIAAAVAAAAVLVAAVLVLAPGRPPPCAGVERRLDGVWDPAVRQGIARAAVAAGIPEAVPTAAVIERELGRYAARWVAVRRDVCLASRGDRGPDPAALASRNACLDLRLRAFQLVVGHLAAPDRAAFSAVATAIDALPPVDDCARASGPPASGRSSSVREDLAMATAHMGAGKLVEAAAIAGRAAAAARADGDRRAEVEALITVVRSLTNDQPAVATAVAAAAVVVAIGEGDAGAEMDARQYLAAAQTRITAFAAATDNLDRVAAFVAANPDPLREARLALARSGLLGQRSDFRQLIPFGHRALELHAAIYGDDSVLLMRIHRNLAMGYLKLGELDDAERHARRLLALATPLGAHHREVARARAMMAAVFQAQGRDHDAGRELTAVIAALRAYVGDGVDLAAAETNLGNMHYLRGSRPQALIHYRAAQAIGDRIGEPARTRLHNRHNIALVVLEDDPVAAEAMLRESLVEGRVVFGPQHVDVGHSHQALGRALAAQARTADALAELATAQRILEAKLGRDSVDVAEVIADRGGVLRRGDQFAAALEQDREAQRIRDAMLPVGHRDRLWSLIDVAHDRLGLGELAAAVELAAAAVERGRSAGLAEGVGVAHWLLARAREAGGEAVGAPVAELVARCEPGALSTDVRWRARAVCADVERWQRQAAGQVGSSSSK